MFVSVCMRECSEKVCVCMRFCVCERERECVCSKPILKLR